MNPITSQSKAWPEAGNLFSDETENVSFLVYLSKQERDTQKKHLTLSRYRYLGKNALSMPQRTNLD